MSTLLLKIFIFAFLLNVVWELAHSVLYKTCIDMDYKKCVRLLLFMSLKDAVLIVVFYFTVVSIAHDKNILGHYLITGFYILIALLFSFIDEKISIRRGRWEYSDRMPTIYGVGLTPLLELAVTGIISFILVIYFF